MSVADLKQRAKRVALYLAIGCFCLFSTLPFLVMLINTFKQDIDLYRPQNNPFIYNVAPTLNNLRLLFLETNYVRFLWNSLFVGVLVVIITLVLALPAAYSLARPDHRLFRLDHLLLERVSLRPDPDLPPVADAAGDDLGPGE